QRLGRFGRLVHEPGQRHTCHRVAQHRKTEAGPEQAERAILEDLAVAIEGHSGSPLHGCLCIYRFRWQGIIEGRVARGEGRGMPLSDLNTATFAGSCPLYCIMIAEHRCQQYVILYRSKRDDRMNRLDRALGILLLLRGGKTFSAAELSRRFEVSTRTIYRD